MGKLNGSSTFGRMQLHQMIQWMLLQIVWGLGQCEDSQQLGQPKHRYDLDHLHRPSSIVIIVAGRNCTGMSIFAFWSSRSEQVIIGILLRVC